MPDPNDAKGHQNFAENESAVQNNRRLMLINKNFPVNLSKTAVCCFMSKGATNPKLRFWRELRETEVTFFGQMHQLPSLHDRTLCQRNLEFPLGRLPHQPHRDKSPRDVYQSNPLHAE